MDMDRMINLLMKEIEVVESGIYNQVSEYDKGYLHGSHDMAVAVLNELGIEHNYQYFNE